MTMVYAGMAARSTGEYFAVSEKVETLYGPTPDVARHRRGPRYAPPAQGANHRIPSKGWCIRLVELDCALEAIREGYTYFSTTIEFGPTCADGT